MMSGRTWLSRISQLCAFSLLMGILLLGALPGQAAEPVRGGVMTVALDRDPPHLDPHRLSGSADTTLRANFYSTLVSYGHGADIVNDLAEHVEILDPTTYVFSLRKNATFHDGTPVTAEDVKFSFERILDPEVGASWGPQLSIIDTIDIVDDYTVQFLLSEPNAAFLAILARPESAIISKRFVENGGDYRRDVMGSGPFKLESAEPGVRYVATRHEGYHKEGLPYLDRINFVVIENEDAKLAALYTGEADLIQYVPWKAMAELEQDPRYNYYGGMAAFTMLMINTSVEPFNDPRVRRALAYGADRTAIQLIAFSGRGGPIGGGLIPEGHWAYNPHLEDTFTYDPDRARQLLAEAGYPNGVSFSISSMNQPIHQLPSEVLQASLSAAGFNVTLDLQDWSTIVEKRDTGNYQTMMMGTSLRWLDPDFYSTMFESGASYFAGPVGFSDDRIDALLSLGRQIVDESERKLIYEELEERILELSPWVFLAWRENGDAAHTRVHGYEYLPGALGFLSGITLERTWLSD